MLIKKSEIKAQTDKAIKIYRQRGPFHEIRMKDGREQVCKIYYIIDRWVPKSLCTMKVNTYDVPENLLTEQEKY